MEVRRGHVAAGAAKQLESVNPVVRQQVTLPSVIAIPGGVPIKIGNEVADISQMRSWAAWGQIDGESRRRL